MIIQLAGIGIWTKGLNHFSTLLNGIGIDPQAEYTMPAPAAIPARERRRAGHFISLAVEVAHQACEMAQIDKTTIPSVFASALGDTDISDYMCRKLAQPEKLLSPTQFHNSVHNAASGYWSISAQNRSPSTFVSGFDRSFGAGLLEAACQVLAFETPVLMVGYDLATSSPFREMLPIDAAMGVALVLMPEHQIQGAAPGLAIRMNIAPRAGVGGSTNHGVHPMQRGLDLALLSAQLQRGNKQTGTLTIDTPRSGHLQIELSRMNP
jgi:Beta-ketoacyl synthase, N-terminal domain